MRNLFKLVIIVGIFLFTFTSIQGVYAVSDNASDTAVENTNASKTDRAQIAADKMEAKEDKLEARAEKLSEARLRICQAREDRISNRFDNLKSLGARSYENLDKIVTRVDNYYNAKLVPDYILKEYDELMDAIETDKAVVLTLLGEARTVGQDFSCESDDPKGHADSFKDVMQELIAAKKEYRASVRAYVVAVRDLAKVAKTDKVTPAADDSDNSTSSAEINSVQ